ncbi:hypothetical protein ABBQ32_013255 [Trebouxia sp. C0010 RCD-2024]
MVASMDEGRVLVLLLDISAGMWEQLRRNDAQKGSAELPQLGKANFVQQVLLFLNTYLMLQEGNKAAVCAVDGNGSHLLHMPPLSSGQSKAKQHATQSAAEEVLQKLLLHVQANLPGQASLPCWSAALSRALCFIHKQHPTSTAGAGGSKPRILCITGSPDVPAQYIATMNAIFSAQRHGIVIDTCVVGRQDSAFLQQAAHISEGVYLRPKHTGALLQYLLTVYAADTYTRSFMQMPKLTGVDFRASCFCHKKTIDMGYVCSVCLSIFCQKLSECSTCGTPFSASVPATQTARIT